MVMCNTLYLVMLMARLYLCSLCYYYWLIYSCQHTFVITTGVPCVRLWSIAWVTEEALKFWWALEILLHWFCMHKQWLERFVFIICLGKYLCRWLGLHAYGLEQLLMCETQFVPLSKEKWPSVCLIEPYAHIVSNEAQLIHMNLTMSLKRSKFFFFILLRTKISVS